MRKNLFKVIVPLVTFFVCFLLIELGLSFFYPKNINYFVWRPHLEFQYELDTDVLRGVSPFAKSTFNSIGARSDEITNQHVVKIPVFGGSTTECIVLDQKKTWTQILQDSLNDALATKGVEAWVGNFGKSGNGTNQHILQTKEVLKLPEMQDSKIVVYLIGFNDLMKTLKDTERYVSNERKTVQLSAFQVIPDSNLPYYRRTATWKFLKQTKYQINLNKYEKEHLGIVYNDVRATRQSVSKVDEVPNMNRGRAHFANNVDALIKLCRSMNKTPVFLTQPVLWRPNISKESDQQLYTLFENRDNLSTEALYTCMKMFNESLLSVAEKNQATVIDLFNQSKENWFYDDCHYNEYGAQQIADIVSEELQPLLERN